MSMPAWFNVTAAIVILIALVGMVMMFASLRNIDRYKRMGDIGFLLLTCPALAFTVMAIILIPILGQPYG